MFTGGCGAGEPSVRRSVHCCHFPWIAGASHADAGIPNTRRRRADGSTHEASLRSWTLAVAALAAFLFLSTAPLAAGNFETDLALVDHALANNPDRLPQAALDACRPMRNVAVKLYKAGKRASAERRLKTCKRLLKISGY
jgi:hypothetical protein